MKKKSKIIIGAAALICIAFVSVLYGVFMFSGDSNDVLNDVASMLTITYQRGDSPQHVSGDLTLPTTVDGLEDTDGEIKIKWSSSEPGVISAGGTVTRPAGENAEVRLTAKVSEGLRSVKRTFDVTVIHAHDRKPEEIPVLTVEDINARNDGGAEIRVNENEQVVSLSGKYADFKVENADDAMDAAQGVHTLLGLENAHSELDLSVINSSDYGNSYVFSQTYKGYPVIGCTLTISADAEESADYLRSGLSATASLKNLNETVNLSAEDAAEFVRKRYGDGYTVIPEDDLSVYALYEYEDAPIFVYRYAVTDDETAGSKINDLVTASAVDGDIVAVSSRIFTFYERETDKEGKLISPYEYSAFAKDEMGIMREFPTNEDGTEMAENELYHVKVLDQSAPLFMDYAASCDDGKWDSTTVSAFNNVSYVSWWYNKYLKRDSVDGNGKLVTVYVHASGMKDNASWEGDNIIKFYDNSTGTGKTTASALDIAGHEYTHGVARAITPALTDAYYNIPGAINEAYADIFGCIIESTYEKPDDDTYIDWKVGEDWELLRDISNPNSTDCAAKLYDEYYILPASDKSSNDKGGVHGNSCIISHAAYLMHLKGMTRSDLAEIWHLSLKYGYDENSTYTTVRENVIDAANGKALGKYEQIIKDAFDAVGIYEASLAVITYDGAKIDTENSSDEKTIYEELQGATVNIYSGNKSIKINNQTTDKRGIMFTDLVPGKYDIIVSHDDYVTNRVIGADITRDCYYGTTLIPRPTIVIKNTESGAPIAGGNITVYEYDNATKKHGNIITSGKTGSDGVYKPDVPEGSYEITISYDGYYYDDEHGSNTVVEIADHSLQDTLVLEVKLTPIAKTTETEIHVVNAGAGNAPLANAKIEIKEYDMETQKAGVILASDITDTSGKLKSNLYEGIYQLTVSCDGYYHDNNGDIVNTVVETIEVTKDNPVSLVIPMLPIVEADPPKQEPTTYTDFAGILMDMKWEFNGWTPMKKRVVTLTTASGEKLSTRTDDFGYFFFEDFDTTVENIITLTVPKGLGSMTCSFTVPAGYDLNNAYTVAVRTDAIAGIAFLQKATAEKNKENMVNGVVLRSEDPVKNSYVRDGVFYNMNTGEAEDGDKAA